MPKRMDDVQGLEKQFQCVSREFSPMPFWFWNDALDAREIKRQIKDFHQKGINGFVIHPRIGMPRSLCYLGDEFMGFVQTAVDCAQSLEMKVVLYDEGMYPSGSAHGQVVRHNRSYAARGLMMQVHPVENDLLSIPKNVNDTPVAVLAVWDGFSANTPRICPYRTEQNTILIRFDSMKPKPQKVLILMETDSGGHIRGIHFGEDDGQPDAPPAADLLNKDAVQCFIEYTHERYYDALAPYFGNTIIAFFTDEPNLLGRGAKKECIAWTRGFDREWTDSGWTLSDLVALFDDDVPEVQQIRQSYRRLLKDRMNKVYYQTISTWCEQHGVALTGHPSGGDDIGLLKHFHIPGQDIVFRSVAPENNKSITGPESTQGKCAADAARYAGQRRNANEVLGCCGPEDNQWKLKTEDMKWYFDWLFVRGANLIIPHAFYYSLRGLRKQERPPDVGPHHVCWPYYNVVSDYIKRMSWMQTDSVSVTPVAVLCGFDRLPWRIVQPLYQNQLDFHYLQTDWLQEAMQNSKTFMEDGFIRIRKQTYRVLLVEDPALLTSLDSKRLHAFVQQGGKVIVWDGNNHRFDSEEFVVKKRLDELVHMVRSCLSQKIELDRPCDFLRCSRLRKGSLEFFLLVNEGEEKIERELILPVSGSLGHWDAWTGRINPMRIQKRNDDTITVFVEINRRGSMILCVDPKNRSEQPLHTNLKTRRIKFGPWNVTQIESTKPDVASMILHMQKHHILQFETAAYEAKFFWDDPCDTRLIVSFESLGDVLDVTVNDKPCGTLMWRPYEIDITNLLCTGWNRIYMDTIRTLFADYADAE